MVRHAPRILTIGASALLFGCSSGADFTVTGTVTLDGEPLPHALVSFYPEGDTKGLGGTGRTGADGKYTLQPARRGKGIPAGTYQVVISRPLRPDGSPGDPNVPPIESDARETLPAKYSDRAASQLKTEVSKEKTVCDFELGAGKKP
jgi:hypothetical protein